MSIKPHAVCSALVQKSHLSVRQKDITFAPYRPTMHSRSASKRFSCSTFHWRDPRNNAYCLGCVKQPLYIDDAKYMPATFCQYLHQNPFSGTCQIMWKICNNVVIKYLTTFQLYS